MTKMKAVIFYGPHDVRVDSIPVPVCGQNEMRIKVEACAVCGTDLKSYNHGNPRIKAPLVMGHEFTGIIETVGESVTGFTEGERIVMATSISCGECFYCRKGWSNLCINLAPMGFSFPGGMAQYTVIPEIAIRNGHVIKVPNFVEAERACLAEPLSCAVNSVENCALTKGDTVVVVGSGPLGIMNACVAKQQGAGKTILAGRTEYKLKRAAACGCDVTVNTMTQNLEQVVKEQTDGLGADVVIITAPSAKAQEEAPLMTRKRGSICLFASLPQGASEITLDSRSVHYGELRIVGISDSTPSHVRAAVQLLQNKDFPADKLVTQVLPLDEIIQAFELMSSGESLRVVLKL